METGPWLKVSSYKMVKLGIEPVTPGLQGKQFIHYTTAAPIYIYICSEQSENWCNAEIVLVQSWNSQFDLQSRNRNGQFYRQFAQGFFNCF